MRKYWNSLTRDSKVFVIVILVLVSITSVKWYPFIFRGTHRVLPVVDAPVSAGAAAMGGWNKSDEYLAWDPCKSIYYQVNPVGASHSDLKLLKEAIGQAQHLSGLHFENAGTTEEHYISGERRVDQGVRGSEYSPVLISFADATTADLQSDGTDMYILGSTRLSTGFVNAGVVSMNYIISGEIALRPRMEGLSQEQQRAVFLHELGHLIGLEHVADKTEIMFPIESNTSAIAPGPGDRYGFAMQGAIGSCHRGWLRVAPVYSDAIR